MNKNFKLQFASWRTNFKGTKGFTLIELLVVIAVIGILVSFAVVNLIGVRARARDAQRKADLASIQAALELYKADNGRYPVTTSSDWNISTSANWIIDISVPPVSLSPNYIKTMPQDPLNVGGEPWSAEGNYRYGYYSGAWAACATPAIPGQQYILVAQLENKNDPGDGQIVRHGGEAGCNWPPASIVIPLYTVEEP